jgi:tryptophan 2,3-dioxygenase
MLRPASGFQSWQFKELEAKLGLKFDHRHGKEYYTSQLRKEHIDKIKKAEAEKSLLELVNAWLERMPSLPPTPSKGGGAVNAPDQDWGNTDFWNEYKMAYANSLAETERNNLDEFDLIFFKDEPTEVPRSLSAKACRAALFIMLYRGYPMLQLPFQLLNALLEIDEQLSSWRYRHMNMVHRMIGTRIGTGGSSGKDYLKAAADKHFIFRDIAMLNSFLIERRKLPALPHAIEQKLGFLA